jgi:hypothetical protein
MFLVAPEKYTPITIGIRVGTELGLLFEDVIQY